MPNHDPTFEALPGWIEQIQPLLQEGVPIVLLGSKTDLASQTDPAATVTAEEAQTLADTIGATAWEASALRQSGAVEVVFGEVLRLALRWKLKGPVGEPQGELSPSGGMMNVAEIAERLERLEEEAAELQAP